MMTRLGRSIFPAAATAARDSQVESLGVEHWLSPARPRMDSVPGVVIVTSRAAVRTHASRALVSMGCATLEYSEPPQEIDEISQDLYVIDGDDPGCLAFARELRQQHPTTPSLLLTRRSGLEIAQLLTGGVVDNIVARRGATPADDLIDEAELISTCGKLLSRDIFGLDKYLPNPAVHVHRYSILNRNDRSRALTALSSFLNQLRCPEIGMTPIITAADELVLNAMFSAPSNNSGRPKYEHLQRSTDLVLERAERFDLSFACDGRHVALAVTDRFGRLDRAQIAKYLAAHFEHKQATLEEREGGAGLGLRMVFSSVAQLIFNVDPGMKTEVIALFYVRNGYRGMVGSGQSLNIFSTQR